MVGVDQKTADSSLTALTPLCPYSNAIKGNVDVQIAVRFGELRLQNCRAS